MMCKENMKAGKSWIAALAVMLFMGLAPVTNAAASGAQVKVVITGDLNVILTDFLNPHVGVADAKNHTYGLTLTVAYPLEGEVEVYFPQNLKPGTYSASNQMTKGKPVEVDFYCTMMMSGDSTGCDSYTGHAEGTLKLTKTGNVYSGSFDAMEETIDGSRKVHVVGTFDNLPLKKK
jgi:hypothetical protein